MSNFFIEKRQVTIVKLLKTRWANKLKNLLNQESIIFKSEKYAFLVTVRLSRSMRKGEAELCTLHYIKRRIKLAP